MGLSFQNKIIAVGMLLLALAPAARSERVEPAPPALSGVTVTEKLGQKIPLDLEFTDEEGHKVKIGDYFKKDRPVMLTLNYYQCPMLCTLQLNGLIKGLQDLDLDFGADFQIVTVSFDPGETWKMARLKKQTYLKELGRAGAESGWAFLTGRSQPIKTLADSVGYGYRWDDATQQYVHPAVVMVLTPDGTVSRYLYGIEFDQKTLRLAAVEAADGKVGSTLDRFILFCFQYNAEEGKYAVSARILMKVFGAIWAIIIASVLFTFWRMERNRTRDKRREEAPA
ncbi:MAG: SCO family protein [Candidatus Omnitrophica bacterium]|nr:SCO family protein [Candidatus Omnitrophota bacterium]